MSEHPVIEAIRSGDVEGLKKELQRDPAAARVRSSAGVSALLEARYRSRMDMLSLLLPSAGPLDIFEAAALGRTPDLERELSRDPMLVSSFSADGFQPLHLAAFFGQLDAARILISRGADPNVPAQNAMAVYPINSAAAARNRDIVALLLDAGADPDAMQHGGWSALHSAAHNGDGETAMLLVRKGADPSLRAATGQTPADMAEEKGFGEIAEMLR